MQIPSITETIRRWLIVGIAIVARIRLPRWLEPVALAVTRSLIQTYRITLSPWLGRQCLFQPSCSERSHTYLNNRGWVRGIEEVDRQLHRCCGNFVVRVTQEGFLEVETVDGEVFPEEELSSLLLAQYRTAWSEVNGKLDGKSAA